MATNRCRTDNTGGQKDDRYNMNQYTRHIEQSEGGLITPTAPWYDRSEATQKTIATMRKDSTVFIITGDTARNKVQVMQGGGHSTEAVIIPENWDELMEAKGYPALQTFYLNEQGGGAPTTMSTNGSPIRFNGKIIVNEEHKNIAVYDTSGKMVGRTNSHFNIRKLPAGVYMVYVAGYKGVACKVVNP